MPASRPLTNWTGPWEDLQAPARSAAPRRARLQSTPAQRHRPPTARTSQRRTRAASPERTRRLRHLRALRRDLLIDVAAAFALMLFVVIATAGLGVVLLLEIPVGALVVTSFVIERRHRRQRRRR